MRPTCLTIGGRARDRIGCLEYSSLCPPPPAVPIVSVEESGELGVQLTMNCWLSAHEALGSIPTAERKRARDEGGREGKNQSVSMAP